SPDAAHSADPGVRGRVHRRRRARRGHSRLDPYPQALPQGAGPQARGAPGRSAHRLILVNWRTKSHGAILDGGSRPEGLGAGTRPSNVGILPLCAASPVTGWASPAKERPLPANLVAFDQTGRAPVIPMNCRNSARVRASSRKVPVMRLVIIDTLRLRTPRVVMHWCTASTTTPTPRGFNTSSMQPAICAVSFSCTVKRRAYPSTTRASLLIPTTLLLGR